MIISDDQIFAKTIGKKTLEKGSKSLAKSAGEFIPFLLLLQFSLVALFGAGPTGSVTITGKAEVDRLSRHPITWLMPMGWVPSLTNGTETANQPYTEMCLRTGWEEWTVWLVLIA